jgi:hypothetical protein
MIWRWSFMLIKISYAGYRFLPAIIQKLIWLIAW